MKLNWDRYNANLNSWGVYDAYHGLCSDLTQEVIFTRDKNHFKRYRKFGIFYQIYEECDFYDFHKIRNFVRKWNREHDKFNQIALWKSKREIF